MKQLDLLPKENNIPSGLQYIANFISRAQEDYLLERIDQQNWLSEISRRVQHYGYKYDYTSNIIDKNINLGDIPDWLSLLSKRLFAEEIFKRAPDQIIINEYLPGQGIRPHTDCIPCFEETICSLSLLSPCLMELAKNEEKTSIYLENRSLLILSGPARFQWEHGISNRKYDIINGEKILRNRRVSITFRKIKLDS